MNKRYQKVLALYSISTLIPTLLNRRSERSGFTQWIIKTVTGYGIFAAGLKEMTKAKNKKTV
ncbi:hypothetical protein ERX37_07195 [Macrococcus hajekii]|uniref:Uncharacterized protein n=1 Tax=Macrococcus hajekii TaxID=198482 RepID=A0A4R6BK45_9STAP|nr:hypothetical protein [Macrococcus hajekii]TDM01986.1 hypothetical protein ERX37_07195 [Macrococcus hajekii]GGB09072.1 hypothetical protein GCM10007190_16420 [Macrococcus hajekii]